MASATSASTHPSVSADRIAIGTSSQRACTARWTASNGSCDRTGGMAPRDAAGRARRRARPVGCGSRRRLLLLGGLLLGLLLGLLGLLGLGRLLGLCLLLGL